MNDNNTPPTVIRTGINPLWLILALLALAAVSCVSIVALAPRIAGDGDWRNMLGLAAASNPTATPTASDPTATPTASDPTATPTDKDSADNPKEDDDLKPVIAGGDFFAIGWTEILSDDESFIGEGWYRLTEPTNSREESPEYCAWATQWQIATNPSIFTENGPLSAQWPHCVELRLSGTGDILVEVYPDEVGYQTSNISGQGLALWPAGVNGTYKVSIDDGETWTEEIELTTGPEGVNVPLSWDEDYGILIFFQLANGYVQMPLGEIRNQVIPAYGPKYVDPRD